MYNILKRSMPGFCFYSDIPMMQNVVCRCFSQVPFFSFSLWFKDLDSSTSFFRALIVVRQKLNLALFIIFASSQCKIWQFSLFLWINENYNSNLSVFLNAEIFVKGLCLFFPQIKIVFGVQIVHIYLLSSFINRGDNIF